MLGAPPTVVPTRLKAGQTSTLRRDIARAQLSTATRGEDHGHTGRGPSETEVPVRACVRGQPQGRKAPLPRARELVCDLSVHGRTSVIP